MNRLGAAGLKPCWRGLLRRCSTLGAALSTLLIAALVFQPAQAFDGAAGLNPAELRHYCVLLDHARKQRVVDAHEHLLAPEAQAQRYLSFYNLLADYVKWDLYGAGMPEQHMHYLPWNEADAVAQFARVEPFLPLVEHGAYMRSVKLTLKMFYGMDGKEGITRDNFLEIGRRLNADNTPARYRQILADAGIVKILQQSVSGTAEPPLFANLTTLGWQEKLQRQMLDRIRTDAAATPEDLFALYAQALRAEKAAGTVGIKMFPHVFTAPFDAAAAARDVQDIRAGRLDYGQYSALARYLFERQVALAGELQLVVAIHLGVWGDITDKTPALLFPLVRAHPKTTFDIYHMGIPYVRETAFLGKNFPNVNLNLCWAYSVSDTMVENTLDEWLDTVPTNKIIGFGGDVQTLPQQVVAMLDIARQTLARVLARRIERGRMDLPGAQRILEDWLYNNPVRIYRLDAPVAAAR